MPKPAVAVQYRRDPNCFVSSLSSCDLVTCHKERAWPGPVPTSSQIVLMRSGRSSTVCLVVGKDRYLPR
jgi:hypothetical protein